MHEGISNLV